MIGRHRNRLVNIIKQNDLPQFRQFIASCSPEDVVAPGTPYLEDTLFNAASYGSPEVLHTLLEVYAAAPEVVKKLNRKFRLLIDACGASNVDLVRFVLDSHDCSDNRLPLGTVDLYERDDSGATPILAATELLMYLDKDADEVEDEGLHWKQWIRNRIARSHQLINFLLDRGCSATELQQL